jgi:hypothetical protein
MALWDPGLQPERTALAWRRTAIAMATVALIVIRSALGRGAWAGAIAAGAALVLGALTLGQSGHGYTRASQRLGEELPHEPLADPRTATAGVVLLAAAAILTAVI